ncbi:MULTISPECIES: hypothetical protein [Bradyrhizobium]|uniref:hypothetical protein n=1 Tax=Bradyrhizobium elkanii TaxID=29448 RepID=UPI0012BBD294|nr:hypothetical protein [Bradyrhizobium elkanii]
MDDLAVGGLLATCIGLAGAAFLFPDAFYNLAVAGAGLFQRLEVAGLAQTHHLLPLK